MPSSTSGCEWILTDLISAQVGALGHECVEALAGWRRRASASASFPRPWTLPWRYLGARLPFPSFPRVCFGFRPTGLVVLAALDKKVSNEVAKSWGLERELGELRQNFQRESDGNDLLRVTVGFVLDDLSAVRGEGTISLATRMLQVTERVREMATEGLHIGVQCSSAIAHSHYEDINLDLMSEGFTPGYSAEELHQIEADVAPLA